MPVARIFRPPKPRPERGFTLMELVVVILIAGVLAVVIAPRFLAKSQVEFQGAYDEALAAVRHAQKVAIASQSSVYVQVSGNTLSVCFGTVSCSSAVTDPSRGSSLVVSPASGVTLSGTSFAYDAIGRPSAAPVFTVAGGGLSRTFTVEAETGHVHP